jgi:hypothetical protein
MRTSVKIALLIPLLSLAARAQEALNHYGAASIPDKAVETAFSSRFNAEGRPIFLIGDIRRGVAIGDIIRFRNKVILIDEEVWQTMKSTGVLDKIKNAPVVELSAQSSSQVWKSRADLAEGKEKIAYTLGSEFITVLEDYFGKIPERAEIGFRFEGNKMTVMAPSELLGVLRFIGKPGEKAKETPNSTPVIVSEAPRRAFEGQPFTWTLWAVDRGSPSTDLNYDLDSKLPPGLHWDEHNHAIAGKPEKAGVWKIRTRAVNAAKHSDELTFDLAIVQNGRPKIGGEPAREIGADGIWRFQPYISDPDHLLAELKLKPFSMPEGMSFDQASHTFLLKTQDAAQVNRMSFGLEVTDPLGAEDKRTFNLSAPSGMRFESALNSSELLQGQSSSYKPVAQGPGHDIRYSARDGNGKVEVNDGRIALSTSAPGGYLMEITAEDELGNQARQMLSYQVLAHDAPTQDLSIEARQLSGGSGGADVDLYYRLGRARFGTMFSEVDKLTLPFFFAGFEPLPAALGGKGNRMYLDMGFNFAGASGITYGGFLLRLDGQYHKLRESPLVFKYTAQYFARQGIVLFNPHDFKKNDLGNAKLQSCLADLRSRTDQADSLVSGFLKCDEDAGKIVDQYGSGDNEIFLVEMALWLNLGHAVGAGPVYWLEDHFHSDKEVDQHVGLGLTHEGGFSWFGYAATVKAGIGKGLSTAQVLFDFSLHFGKRD